MWGRGLAPSVPTASFHCGCKHTASRCAFRTAPLPHPPPLCPRHPTLQAASGAPRDGHPRQPWRRGQEPGGGPGWGQRRRAAQQAVRSGSDLTSTCPAVRPPCAAAPLCMPRPLSYNPRSLCSRTSEAGWHGWSQEGDRLHDGASCACAVPSASPAQVRHASWAAAEQPPLPLGALAGCLTSSPIWFLSAQPCRDAPFSKNTHSETRNGGWWCGHRRGWPRL